VDESTPPLAQKSGRKFCRKNSLRNDPNTPAPASTPPWPDTALIKEDSEYILQRREKLSREAGLLPLLPKNEGRARQAIGLAVTAYFATYAPLVGVKLTRQTILKAVLDGMRRPRGRPPLNKFAREQDEALLGEFKSLARTGEYSSNREVVRIMCGKEARLRLAAERIDRGEDLPERECNLPLKPGAVEAMERRLRHIRKRRRQRSGRQ
jgi:hypothetical protein